MTPNFRRRWFVCLFILSYACFSFHHGCWNLEYILAPNLPSGTFSASESWLFRPKSTPTALSFQVNSWKCKQRNIDSQASPSDSLGGARSSQCYWPPRRTKHGLIIAQTCSEPTQNNHTITYRVFHHDLLITELHYIDFKYYTDGIHGSKAMLHGHQKI